MNEQTPQKTSSDIPTAVPVLDYAQAPRGWSTAEWVWFTIKNVIGWVLILVSGPIGLAVPGPGGLPLFIIGFGLITFPGKRRLTARVLRGMPVDPEGRAYRVTVGFFAIVVPAVLLTWVGYKFKDLFNHITARGMFIAALYASAVALLWWIFAVFSHRVLNWIIARMPWVRRKCRPKMRSWGMDLLPPRRRRRLRRGAGRSQEADEEILEIDERHHERVRSVWRAIKPWVFRLVRVAVIGLTVVWMVRPIYQKWPVVRVEILNTNWWNFALAAAMFSMFLFAGRSLAWRWIMKGLGHELPVGAATRIWSMSELARYMPGVIWQVVGRVYLCKPYGIGGAVCSASQLLELSIFMLANILIALTCLSFGGLKRIPADQRHWVYMVMVFVPLLLLLLHPRVFYSLLNGLLKRLKRAPITARLKKRMLLKLLLWAVVALLWQSLAIWLVTHEALGLPLVKWWLVAGCYCLAWTVGFSAGFLSPGGIGIRELVFITTMAVMLPPEWVAAHPHLRDPAMRKAFLGFLGILLRLWAISGELTMAGCAFLADYKGALRRPGAPGQILNSADSR